MRQFISGIAEYFFGTATSRFHRNYRGEIKEYIQDRYTLRKMLDDSKMRELLDMVVGKGISNSVSFFTIGYAVVTNEAPSYVLCLSEGFRIFMGISNSCWRLDKGTDMRIIKHRGGIKEQNFTIGELIEQLKFEVETGSRLEWYFRPKYKDRAFCDSEKNPDYERIMKDLEEDDKSEDWRIPRE